MSHFKFSPNLFLEVAELDRFKSFIDTEGFRKNIIQNTVSFGLIKKNNDLAFLNGKVERDLDGISGQRTIKIRSLQAIDNQGLFLSSSEINGVVIPEDGRWYWIRASHRYDSTEVGTVTLAINGDMTGVNTKFTQVLRGMPNFPARIKFTNSQFNTLEYDVLEVIDDEHAIVVHPAVNSTGTATFETESELKYSVVGTFTPGVGVPSIDKYPYQYDSVLYEVIAEIVSNQRPSFIEDQQFNLARVKVVNGDVIIQDKRINQWTSQGKSISQEIDNTPNPLIGVEYIKWQNSLSPANRNQLYLAWGMRSQNWAIDSSKNILTLFGSATGGLFKTVNDFTNGDFDGWRVYVEGGTYTKVIASIRQGQAINLTLDVLDVDDYSQDGGLTFNNQGQDSSWVLVVPDCEEVELTFTPEIADNQNSNQTYIFPVNTLISKSELEVYGDPTCLFNVKYRYKTNAVYSQYAILPSNNIGYYAEASFDDDGIIKPTNDRVLYPYTSIEEGGYIQLTLSINSYSILINKIYKGDKIGVQTVNGFNSIQVYELKVGRDKQYQYITGAVVLNDDVYINLSELGAVEGNEFRIHLDCQSLIMNGKSIFIVRNYTAGQTPVIIKQITQRDVYCMMNQDGGLMYDCLFSDTNSWNVVYQNYTLPRQGQIISIDGVINDIFDANGLGKIKGYYGIAISDGRNNTINMVSRFILGAGETDVFKTDDTPTPINKAVAVRALGGYENTVLVEHSHTYTQYELDQEVAETGDGIRGLKKNNNQVGPFYTSTVGESGVGKNYSPYCALIYAKIL